VFCLKTVSFPFLFFSSPCRAAWQLSNPGHHHILFFSLQVSLMLKRLMDVPRLVFDARAPSQTTPFSSPFFFLVPGLDHDSILMLALSSCQHWPCYSFVTPGIMPFITWTHHEGALFFFSFPLFLSLLPCLFLRGLSISILAAAFFPFLSSF